MKLDFCADPGHGWLKVPRKLLYQWGIAGSITSCSYQRGEYVYLEEDCDASTFLAKAKELGVAVTFRERVSRERRSKIRGYAYFRM
jgi:hypothetical protein